MFEQSLVPHSPLAPMCSSSTPRVLTSAGLLSLREGVQATGAQEFLGKN